MTASMEFDEDDGAPVTGYHQGEPLPGGTLAWERLGVGHRSETWLAWSPALWSPVVTKFPRPHQVAHPRARRTLCREVAALDGNLHPGLPRLLADGTTATVPYVTIEHVDGPALDDAVDEHGPLDDVQAASLAVQVLAALRSVHARGIAHVDLKPANVLLRDGRPIVLDFGSARRIGSPQPRGALIGSPGYAAPELEAGEPIAAGMDVYGLGATLHEVLTGEPPFAFDLPAEQRPAPPGLPASPTAELVLCMLTSDPAARPTPKEVLRGFDMIAGFSPAPAG